MALCSILLILTNAPECVQTGMAGARNYAERKENLFINVLNFYSFPLSAVLLF